jgi:chaperone required for assembly of F1-ATPase
MRDELTKPDAAPAAPAADPVALSRQSLKVPLRPRFYQRAEAAAIEGGFAVMLDGRPVLTPAKTRLAAPTLAAAAAVAAEWEAQAEVIDPMRMPLTRILNAALDGVTAAMEAVAAELVNYAGTDLVCYRAAGPESLLRAQAEAWDPILAFAEQEIGARFICIEGVMHVAQPAAALSAVRMRIDHVTAIGSGAPIALACLNVMTTLTGSALIALARVGGALSLEAAWAAAHVDEDFQMRLWGADAEAMARRTQRFNEMAAADGLWQLLRA